VTAILRVRQLACALLFSSATGCAGSTAADHAVAGTAGGGATGGVNAAAGSGAGTAPGFGGAPTSHGGQSGSGTASSGGAGGGLGSGGNAEGGSAAPGGGGGSGGGHGGSDDGGGGALGAAGAHAGGRNAPGGAGGASGHAGAQGSAGAAGSAGADTTEPPPCTDDQRATCTGTSTIECHFGGATGDYEVTVELGGDAAGDAYVEAESTRRMLAETKTPAGTTQRFSFFVNVRQPEGQPIEDVPAGTPGLDLYVRGAAPELASVCFTAKKSAPKLWIAGDSTVCDQDGTDYAGWGQHLPQFIVPPVSVANYADSGESSGSFLGSSKLWGAIKAGWSAGDFVLIQLGHNDKDTSAATFQSNMSAMVTQAKAAGVSPILVTPTARVGYALADEHVNSTGANLPQIIRDLGASENVPVIDLTVTTWNWLQTVDYTKYYALGTDHTHTNPAGAEVIASFVRDAIAAQQLPLAAYLR